VFLRQEKEEKGRDSGEGRGVEGKFIPRGVVSTEILRPYDLPVANDQSNFLHVN